MDLRLRPAALAALLAFAPSARSQADYAAALTRLSLRRQALAADLARAPKERPAVVAQARKALLAALDEELLPAWYGTPWDFHGTSERPKEGAIACGYFVTTVLRDAGFRVRRAELAQQASEHILLSLSPPSRVLRLRDPSPQEVVEAVRRAEGDGLFLVGMDYHVGFLRLAGERAELCHSAFVEPGHVTCERAVDAVGFRSRYYVVAPLLTDWLLEAWLRERELPTHLPASRRRAR